MLTAAALGHVVKDRLPAAHRAQEAIQLAQLNVTLLVTFIAIVLGLLTTSVKAGFDAAYDLRGTFAGQLVQLDNCLRDYGPETSPIREQLRSYTAASIASTWSDEPPPKGVKFPDKFPDTAGMPAGPGESLVLGEIINNVGRAIQSLNPTDTPRQNMLNDCIRRYDDLIKSRWALIESERGSISPPFYWVLVFWLTVLFTCLGLCAPRGAISVIAVVLSAISITVAVYVILDLDLPYGGVFGIPSQSMRNALADMMR